jgi:hypothetical protein
MVKPLMISVFSNGIGKVGLVETALVLLLKSLTSKTESVWLP